MIDSGINILVRCRLCKELFFLIDGCCEGERGTAIDDGSLVDLSTLQENKNLLDELIESALKANERKAPGVLV